MSKCASCDAPCVVEDGEVVVHGCRVARRQWCAHLGTHLRALGLPRTRIPITNRHQRRVTEQRARKWTNHTTIQAVWDQRARVEVGEP